MKKCLHLLLFIGLVFSAQAQPFGNEWIVPSQQYYKIKVTLDGMYRIPRSTLLPLGIGTVSTASFALYHNGQQIPIYVSTTANTLGNSDYLEFYGERNRGYIDSLLYRKADDQINPSYSLFTDTSVYFLTTNSLNNNLRYAEIQNVIPQPAPVPESYFTCRSIVNYPTGSYYDGKYYSLNNEEVYKSLYERGEGFTFSAYFGNFQQNFIAPTPSLYTGDPNLMAQLKVNYANNSLENHITFVQLNGTQVYTQNHFGFKLNKMNVTIPTTQLHSGNDTITFYASDNAFSQKQNMVGYLEVVYPRDFNAGGANIFQFTSAASPSKKYIEVNNFNDNNTVPVLFDVTNGWFYRSAQPAGSSPVKFHILNSGVERNMYLCSDDASGNTTVQTLTPVSFVDYSNITNQGKYIVISNSVLFNDGSGKNWVEEYRTYRDLDNGGKYKNCKIISIDLLYDQFGYGIAKSPLAIRNFIAYATSTWGNLKPEYVFLIGKGRESKFMRSDAGVRTQCLVPTFGFPGSDNLLAATRQSDFPLVAIGRLAAENGLQVKDYLDKIKDYEKEQSTYDDHELIENKIWQKQLLHFSGGTSSFEQSLFRAYVNNYKKIAADTSWGANTTSFSKTSSDPIDVQQSQVIKTAINKGVSWITFFGHSATGAFDFSIDEPENYNNRGKYPIILSNGCFAGFIHDAAPGYSERFVFKPAAGAIAFMATSSLSTPGGLNNFSDTLYRRTCRLNYTEPLGKAVQQTLTKLYTYNYASDNDMMMAYEMTLHGDPGLIPNQYPKPDYAIEQSSLFFNPSSIQPGLDSFEVKLVVTNLGKAIKDSIAITLKRTIFDANGSPVVFNNRILVGAPYYIDTVTFKLPVKVSTLGYGENRFEPYVDADYKINEMAEGNNGLLTPVSIQIQSDDIIPIYPYEFAIVPKQGVTLKASTVNPFAPKRSYKLEIDTSELFAAPLQSISIYQGGGVVHWQPTITYKDSTVYYWRVGKDSAGAAFHYSSFIYLKDEYPGWNQSHYFQWKKDDYPPTLRLDSSSRIFKYPPSTNEIHVKTGNAYANNPQYESLGWDYNNYNEYRWRMGNCGNIGYSSGLTFAVIDNVTGVPWMSENSVADNFGDKFSNIHCSGQYYLQAGFDFLTQGTNPNLNEPWSSTIGRFIDSIPAGFYVLVYSVNQVPYLSWDTALVQKLQSIGMVQASSFQKGDIKGPLVYFTQKGNLNYQSYFDFKPDYQLPLEANITFTGNWFAGFFTTPKIGPAVEWGSVHWKRRSLNNLATDSDRLEIIGVNTNGFDTVLVTTADSNILFNNSISATQFPYIKLRLYTSDDANRTPAQLRYWRVLYKKPPEAAINPAAWFKISDSVNLGQNLHVEIALENVTELHMDSMLTKYIMRDAQFNNQTFKIRQDTLGGLDTMILVFDKPINGNTFNGLNKLIIEANPDNDQIEQFHFNNFAEINFSSAADKINPLLDVTFDHQHILNGDVVSAKPDILITLKDENKFLALNDTSLMNVFLKYPNEATPRRISYDDVIMKFYPADSTKLSHGNKAQIELKPGFVNALPDGKYELTINDRDRNGNNSSSTTTRHDGNLFFDYRISFEIINKSMISNVLNYPNPFTTATKFVFTITGSEVPDFMKIQIMTIKGTVVKEIFKEELGPLRIGTNITEYAWDGRDQYGDLLANGIYFYTVSTRLDNKQMDQMGMTYDKFFKKGFGKMAIVR